jgi:ABC-type molybdenum transport system ATPase subunit/photorepair protein PhrA
VALWILAFARMTSHDYPSAYAPGGHRLSTTIREIAFTSMTEPSPNPTIPTSEAIRFEHVSVRFGGVRALDDVSFSVGRGEVHCLAGENGSGKSTLIKIIAGVYRAAPGAATEYFGESVANPTPQLARRKGVAVIWQD